jgi:hypothetical protein
MSDTQDLEQKVREQEQRIERLEGALKKMMPSRREAIKGGGLAALAGASFLGGIGTAGATDSITDDDTKWGSSSNRDDWYADYVDANVVSTDSATIGGDPGVGLGQTDGINASLGGGWAQESADRPVMVELNAEARTDGSVNGTIEVDVDEDGGTTADYTMRSRADKGASSSAFSSYESWTIYLPAGAQWQIRNASDPTGLNRIFNARKVVG